MFLRFIKLSFLVPGAVSPSLPPAFAVPAAYGDLAAGIAAVFATIALVKEASWAIPAVRLFNVWGAADVVFALTLARMSEFIPKLWVPRFIFPQRSCHPHSLHIF